MDKEIDCKDRARIRRGNTFGTSGAFIDKAPEMKGHLKITVKNAKTGVIEKVVDVKNLVMTFTRTQISHLFAGDFDPDVATNARYIISVSLGTSGTSPAIDDLAITDPVTITPLSVTYPSDYSVQFSAELDSLTGNGIIFREAGLYFGSPAGLATRVVFSSMTKSSLWAWDINWILQYS